MRFSTSSLFVLLAACAAACSSSTPSAPAPGTDDAGADAGAASCDAFAPNAFPIEASGPNGQIHGIGASGGDRVFVTYNRPKAGAKTFDVVLTALKCNGTLAFDAVRVSEDDDNDVDPSIAVRGETVLVAWGGDAAGQDPNLHLRTRLFDRQGTAIGAATTFTGPRKGVANTKYNTWQASVASLGEGFALAGAWGTEEAPAFQAFGSRLDAKGLAIGDAFELGFDAGTSQTLVDVATGGEAAWAAWLVEANTFDAKSVATTTFGLTGTPTRGPTLDDATSPTVAMSGTTAWVAAQRGASDVVLQRLDAPGAAKVLAGKGLMPALALSPNGGAFASYRDGGGGRTIVVTRIDAAGDVMSETDLAITDAAPYPLRLVRVADDVYFLAFQQGKGSAIRAMARFFDYRAK
jgi:hypothetical protein